MFGLIILSLAIILAVYFLNRIMPSKICAVCAGISGTWLLATLGILIGLVSLEEYGLAILMLMGATVVGIANQGEKTFVFAQKSIWFWKIPSIIIGLPLFYWLFLNIGWFTFGIEAILMLFLLYVFFIRKNHGQKKSGRETDELKKQLEECC